jgi:hypothetical protein
MAILSPVKTLAPLILAVGALALASCASEPRPVNPAAGAYLERMERSAPTTDAPYVHSPSYGNPANNYPYRQRPMGSGVDYGRRWWY